MTLTVAPSSTPALEVSKWNRIGVLMEVSELQALLAYLPLHTLHPIGRSVSTCTLFEEAFLEIYASYIALLKQGIEPDRADWGRQLSLAMTVDSSALFAVSLDRERVVVRAASPVLQLQHHQFHFSEQDLKVYSGVLGHTISWGLQFSFPQLWLDANQRVVTLRKEDPTGNASLFLMLQRWLRKQTQPLLLFRGEHRIPTSIRISPLCCQWIESHPGLVRYGLRGCR